MILEIKKYPNPILRKKCSPVQILRSKTWSGKEIKEISDAIKELAKNMMETMMVNQGVGLAAPQVGRLLRIIIVRFEEAPRVFINPKIVKKGKEMEVAEEGCLSFPGIRLKIKRAKSVEVEALDMEGKKLLIKADDLLARIFQHEIDHLDGILFIDRASFWQKIKRKFTLLNPPKAVSR